MKSKTWTVQKPKVFQFFRFDCLHVTLNPNSTAAKVMDAADKINNNVLATDNSLITRFWKWESKPFKETKEGMKVLQEISRSFLKEKMQHMKDSEMDDEKVSKFQVSISVEFIFVFCS